VLNGEFGLSIASFFTSDKTFPSEDSHVDAVNKALKSQFDIADNEYSIANSNQLINGLLSGDLWAAPIWSDLLPELTSRSKEGNVDITIADPVEGRPL
jgi:spermidine/putrescine-binding protein